MADRKFSFLVFEKNVKEQINESNTLIKILEEEKKRLKNWTKKILEKQERLIEETARYKHQLKIEIESRVKLEEYLREIQGQESKSTSEQIGYSRDTQEEIVMNTNKMLKKVKENPMIEEVFLKKTDYNKIKDLVIAYKLDQAYIKVIQFLCEMIDCTSSLPNEEINY